MLSSSQILKIETPPKAHGKKKKMEIQSQFSFGLSSQLFTTQAFHFMVDTCSVSAKPTPRTIERVCAKSSYHLPVTNTKNNTNNINYTDATAMTTDGLVLIRYVALNYCRNDF